MILLWGIKILQVIRPLLYPSSPSAYLNQLQLPCSYLFGSFMSLQVQMEGYEDDNKAGAPLL